MWMTRLPGFSATTALPANNFCFISTTCSSDDFFNPIMRYHQPAPVGAGFQFLKSGISPAILKNDHFRGILLRLPPASFLFRVAISPAILKNDLFRGVLLRLPPAGSAFRVAISPAILKNNHFRGVLLRLLLPAFPFLLEFPPQISKTAISGGFSLFSPQNSKRSFAVKNSPKKPKAIYGGFHIYQI